MVGSGVPGLPMETGSGEGRAGPGTEEVLRAEMEEGAEESYVYGEGENRVRVGKILCVGGGGG